MDSKIKKVKFKPELNFQIEILVVENLLSLAIEVILLMWFVGTRTMA